MILLGCEILLYSKCRQILGKWKVRYIFLLYCIRTKKLSCLKSRVEFDMNDILYEFKNLHHF